MTCPGMPVLRARPGGFSVRLEWAGMEFWGDLSTDPPVLRLPAALEPVVRRTLAGRDRLHLFERHRYRAAGEEPLSGAENHGVDEQPVLVDQVVLQQCLERVGAAPGVQGAAGLLAQLPELGNYVALDQAGVVPGDTLEAARQHVFW